MKKDKKIIQAIVVIVVVGIGWFHNVDKNSYLYKQFRTVAVNSVSNNDQSDTLQVKENKIYLFTKNIIDSSIQHLISNLWKPVTSFY